MKRSLLYQVGGEEAAHFELFAKEVALADELGLHAVWCLPAVSSLDSLTEGAPVIWLSGLAERTKGLRLGWGVPGLTPPERAPIRIAEQAASVDLGSAGRLDVALVPDGAFALEAPPPGWDEGLRMLVEMWEAPQFAWSSERFEVAPIEVVPKPVQNPHPPLFLVGWSVEHARAAGDAGAAFLDVSGGDDELLEFHRDTYKAARAQIDPSQLVSHEAFSVAVDLEPNDSSAGRLAEWERMGIDEIVLRAGPLEGGHEQAMRRIRFLAHAESVTELQ